MHRVVLEIQKQVGARYGRILDSSREYWAANNWITANAATLLSRAYESFIETAF
jgi:hypothetical protein